MFINLPEITVQELESHHEAGAIVLDVREIVELQTAAFPMPVVHLPLSKLAERLLAAIPAELEDKTQPVVVVCHHGNRSAQVTAWLRQQGWENVVNLAGGIDAYATYVNPSIPRY